MRLRSVPRFRPYLSAGILKRLLQVLVKEDILTGKWIERFEQEFSDYIGRRHAIAVPSGRMALHLTVSALGFGEGDEIVVPAFTAPEVVTILRCSHITPRFADVDPTTYNLVPETIHPRITPATRAILMTHMFGKPCRVDDILSLAEAHRLETIEDAAQACGASYDGRKTGCFGRVSTFSFGLVKNLNTLGGGMIATDDDDLAKTIRRLLAEYPLPGRFSVLKELLKCLLLWGMTQPFFFSAVVFPVFRLLDEMDLMDRIDAALDEKEISAKDLPKSYRKRFTNLQGAMGSAQLEILDKMNRRRMDHAAKLMTVLTETDMLSLPGTRVQIEDIRLNLPVRSANRDRMIRRLRRHGVDTTKGYLRDCSGMAEFAEFGCRCPVSEALSRQGYYLPVYSYLNEKEVDIVIQAVQAALREESAS